jgi:hypothetical protein
LTQQRSGTQFVGLELPVAWGSQDGSKEPSRRYLEYWKTIIEHSSRNPSSKINARENGRIIATKYKRAKKKI